MPGNYLLATVHRASNTDTEENLQEICKAFIELAKEINPVGYLEMLILTKNAGKIITNSGGLQKEAYFAKVPCITLDTVLAWPETVDDGWNIVIGEETARQQLRRENIINAVRSFEPNKKQQNIFGNGKAAEKICYLLVC